MRESMTLSMKPEPEVGMDFERRVMTIFLTCSQLEYLPLASKKGEHTGQGSHAVA